MLDSTILAPGGVRSRRASAALRRGALAVGLVLASAVPSPAEVPPPALGLPLACEPTQDCWIPRYVDVDPGPGIADHACGTLTGDGHKGTDFAIPDLAALDRGVPVLAAAAGTVRGTRDGMADVSVDEIGEGAVAGRECGNGVVLDHGGGWETQYCHLRRGSVAVGKGDQVEAGAKLGFVGLSGEASFPHVHLSVRRDGTEIDPFTGRPPGEGCNVGGAPLWRPEIAAKLAYDPVVLARVGIAPGRPDWDGVQKGGYGEAVLPDAAEALVVWVEGYGLRAGDVLRFRVRDRDGREVYAHDQTEAKAQARFFRFAGRRPPSGGFLGGAYTATVALERNGAAIGEKAFAFTVP
ncbi:MAG: M23 family metallopeptidase [Geminicoccaceae bacterium]|nr:M23 family metallopeptidase [Geminicoccaceae bacterium]